MKNIDERCVIFELKILTYLSEIAMTVVLVVVVIVVVVVVLVIVAVVVVVLVVVVVILFVFCKLVYRIEDINFGHLLYSTQSTFVLEHLHLYLIN